MATEEARPRHLELPDYVRILSKRKWFILVVTAVATLVGGLYALSSERVYVATALVLVQQRPEGFFWVTGEDASLLPTVAMETSARIARSTEVATIAAERLAEFPQETRIIATPGEIQASLNVGVIHPDLLRIDCTSSDERRARLFANTVATAFVLVNTEDRQRQSRLAREFLVNQVEVYRVEMDDLIDELSSMARRSGYVDLEAEISGALTDLRGFENRRRELVAEVEAADARLAELLRLQRTEPEVLVSDQPQPNPEWEVLNRQLAEANAQLQRSTAQYTANHPEVLELTALVAQLRQEMAATPVLVDRPTPRLNPARADVEREIKTTRVAADEARARLEAFSRVVGGIEAQLTDLPEERQRWQALGERLTASREAYQSLQRELRQARLTEAIREGNARVVDTAETSRTIQASLGRSLVFAGALGLFVGLALAILLEALDDTIYSVEDLQRVTDLYLLGVVPLRSDEAGPLVTVDAPKSPPAEAYRTLRSNVRFSLFDKPAKTFVVTSAGSGEGKSATAANLAVAYAQSGDSVILVDTDIRRPMQHRIFRINGDLGITNVLVGDTKVEDVLKPTEIPGLRLITSGPLPPNPAELLESEQMTRAIEQLTELADVVIFDSPPAVMLTDAVILASKVDRTILVAESGQITERAIHDIERIFRHARAEVLGLVFNKLRVTGGDYYYYYYYYYDYSSRPSRPADAALDPTEYRPPSADPSAAGPGAQEPQDLAELNVAPRDPDYSPGERVESDGPADLSEIDVPDDEGPEDAAEKQPADDTPQEPEGPDDLSEINVPPDEGTEDAAPEQSENDRPQDFSDLNFPPDEPDDDRPT